MLWISLPLLNICYVGDQINNSDKIKLHVQEGYKSQNKTNFSFLPLWKVDGLLNRAWLWNLFVIFLLGIKKQNLQSDRGA